MKRISAWPRIALGPSRTGLLGAICVLLLVTAPFAGAQALTGTVATDVAFPNRTIVLTLPPGVSPTTKDVHVAENGHPVTGLSVTSLKRARLGDLGVMLLIDTDPSMVGAPLNRALAAARTLASERLRAQELGVIFGDGKTLPLTTDSTAIDQALAQPPHGHTTLNLLTMTKAAVTALTSAGIADRAIIYVTDDIDRSPSYTPESVGAYATAAHVRIFTVGVKDAIWARPLPSDLPSSSMRTLAESAGGTYSQAVPAQERRAFTDIEAGLVSQYVVHYRSTQPAGKQITMSVRVDDVPGIYQTTYRSPASFHPPRGAAVHRRSFWASSLAIVVVALICGLLLGLAVALLVAHYSRSGRLRARVHAFVPPPQTLELERPAGAPKRAGLWTRLLERRRWWPNFVESVSISDLSRSPEELARLAAVGSLLAAVLVELLTGSIVLAVLAVATGPLVLRAIVNRSVRQQRLRFAEQLSGQLHELASAMRTGRSIVEAVEIVADGADEPMRRELRRTLADERAGLHLDQALLPIADRMESSEIEQVSVIAALHRRTGANITEVLDRIADTARQRVEIRRELNGLTAQARMSRNILIALPILVVIAIDLIGHTYERPLFHTTAGIVFMVIAALMVALGARIMKAIVKVEE